MFNIENPERVENIPEDFTVEDLNAIVTALNTERALNSVLTKDVEDAKMERDKATELNKTLVSRISAKKEIREPEEILKNLF